MRSIVLLLLAAALAGCVDSESPPALPDNGSGESSGETSEPSNGFAPQEGQAEDIQGDLSLVGEFSTCDAGHCIHAVATNEGSEPAFVKSRGQPSPGERMEHDGKEVHPREPMFYTQEFAVREWAPGEQIPFTLEWDGRIWNDETGAYEDAQDGEAYQWFATFWASQDEDGGRPVFLEVGFTVVIGET